MRLACFAVAVLVGCGPEAASSSSIAVAADFQDFEVWESIRLGDEVDGGVIASDGGVIHGAGVRTVYINRRPPPGSTTFPDGTLIVKVQDFDTFAMSKRGGTYNANGAPGWEWLDLVRLSTGALVIKWRGLGPPAGEEYKKTQGTCNTCHGAAVATDSVLTPGLLGN